jgi:multiple sugar transport system permease protein
MLKRWAIRAGVLLVLAVFLFPIYWMVLTSLKTHKEVGLTRPTFLFRPTLDNYRALLPSFEDAPDGGRALANAGFAIALLNSIVIGGASTLIAVCFGTLSAYAFSRFRVPAREDLLFFILSTRMLPPMVIVVPVYVMYSRLGLMHTHIGLIVLYASFCMAFAVWMMKSFIDEIPREYEEAALCDGYTRWQAFRKVVVPQIYPGAAVTAIFCMITAWNEYVFALILNSESPETAPYRIVNTHWTTSGTPLELIAAASVVFLLPVVVCTFLLRKNLLRGMTFGMVK